VSDVLTGTSAISNTVLGAIDQYVRAELRHQPTFRAFVDTRPVNVDRAGSSVKLFVQSDLAVSTTPLNELVDADSVALPNPTSVTLTPNEYGNSTIATIKAKATSFADVDTMQVNAVAYNMRDSLDTLIRDVAIGGTNVIYSGTGNAATADVADGDVLSATDIRKAVTKLRGNAAVGKRGDLYVALLHPDVSADLRSTTGSGSWQDLHKYAAPGNFWPGEVGTFEGAAFVESARCKVATDGTSSEPVYRSLIFGKEALAEGVVIEPSIKVGVVPDRFGRFFPLGWYGFLGWTIFRQKAIYRIESASAFS
jgi:N4-gp56 family major capsid protein